MKLHRQLASRPVGVADGGKVTKRFQAACRAASVRPIRFHDLRHTLRDDARRLRASSLRTLQEFLGHADAKTTQIYSHYAPSAHEVEMVNAAFGPGVGPATQGETVAQER